VFVVKFTLMFPLFLILAFLPVIFAAAIPSEPQWFTVEWDDAAGFTHMSGRIVIPDIPTGNGLVQVWPGLQGDDGVLQAALTGAAGKLSLKDTFQGTSSLPSGEPISVQPGDDIYFSITFMPHSGLWVTTLMSQDITTQTFSVPSSTLDRALFAIRLDGTAHDFAVQYTDLVITSASTPATTWCVNTASNGYGAQTKGYTVEGAVAVDKTCLIEQLILPATA